MEHVVPFSNESIAGRGQQLRALLLSSGVSEDNLNAALLQAASKGHKHILHVLIDAGATNIIGAMTCAGWSGHIDVVDALILRTRPIPFGAAFVGALVGHRKDVIDHVVHVADAEGLDRCLLMGAARIWSCSTYDDVLFLLDAIESLINAGARSFQRAMQVSCGDAVIDYWNGLFFRHKVKILERIVVLGSNHLTADFFGRILLMICVTFLCKLLKVNERRWPLRAEACGTIIQDMISIIGVVCRNGAAELVSRRLLELTDSSLENVRLLLHITPCNRQHVGLRSECRTCKAEWPLELMSFFLVECGVKDLDVSVMFLPAFQAARLNVLLPVVQCFLKQNCFDAFFIYLEMSITFCQGEAIVYLLSVLPRPVDTASVITAVRSAASNTRGPPRGPEGVLFALHANFLDDMKATLVEASRLIELGNIDHVVKRRLRDEWSQQAFEAGMQTAHRHFLSWMLVRYRNASQLRVEELPFELQIAIGYLPLYKNCMRSPGRLLSQRQRGEVITSLLYLYQGSGKVTKAELLEADKLVLLSLLAARLPEFCREVVIADSDAAFHAFFKKQ